VEAAFAALAPASGLPRDLFALRRPLCRECPGPLKLLTVRRKIFASRRLNLDACGVL